MAARWPLTWWTKRLQTSCFGGITNTSALARGPVRIIDRIEINFLVCSGKIMSWQYQIFCLWCDGLTVTVSTLIKQKGFFHVIHFFLFLKRHCFGICNVVGGDFQNSQSSLVCKMFEMFSLYWIVIFPCVGNVKPKKRWLMTIFNKPTPKFLLESIYLNLLL